MNAGSDGSGDDGAVANALQRFSRELRRRRRDAGMTQAAAAAATGTSQGSWSKIEAGQLDPTLGLVLRVVQVFELDSIEALFGPAATGALMGVRRDETTDT